MRKIGYIYLIRNKTNSKCYVGQTRMSIEKRWYYHVYYKDKNKSNSVITKALLKHGENNFEIIELEKCDINILTDREQFWIEYYNCIIPNGYNTLPANRKYDYPQEYLNKLSNSQIKRFEKVEERQKISKSHLESFKNNPKRREGCKKAYEMGLKKWTENNPGYFKNRVSHNKGKKMSDAQKAKLRKPKTRTEKMLNEHKTRSERMKKNNSFKGKKHTEETKKLISEMQSLKRIKVLCINTGQTFQSIREAAIVLGVSKGNISHCLKGNRKTVKGLSFSVIKE
jgi:group I intron endonuclease